METQTYSRPMFALYAVIAVVLLATMACSIGGLTINGNSATLDVTLNQDQVNTLLTNAQVSVGDNQDNLLDKITSVEFHDGFIRVLGTVPSSSGDEVSGSYDISVNAVNNVLVVKIIAVNIQEVTMSDPRITTANQQISEAISKSISDSHGDVLYKNATVTAAGGLHLTIQANFNNK